MSEKIEAIIEGVMLLVIAAVFAFLLLALFAVLGVKP